ncbi:hypothetical protein [Treponema endosymbiont of Eucomonympha sp.]|nr:hypothetical protein [Treponema endosymbiont of Eucomonympha sp.]
MNNNTLKEPDLSKLSSDEKKEIKELLVIGQLVEGNRSFDENVIKM